MQGKEKGGKPFDYIYGALAGILYRRDKKSPTERADRLCEAVKSAVRTALLCLGSFAAGGAAAFGGIMPFGCALICAVNEKIPLVGVFCVLGALVRTDVILPVVYVLLTCARLTAGLQRGTPSARSRAGFAGGGMLLYGILRLITESFSVRGFICALAGIPAAGAAAVCFAALFDGTKRFSPAYESGIYIALYAASCALDGTQLFSLAPSYLIGFTAVAYLARQGGGARGCVAGLAWGLGGMSRYAPAFALAGLICGKARSTLLGVGGGAVGCMIYASFSGGFGAVHGFLPEIALASVLYAPLERYGILPRANPFTSRTPDDPDFFEAEREHLSADCTGTRLQSASAALRSISAIFYSLSEKVHPGGDVTRAFAEDFDMMADLIRSALDGGDSLPFDAQSSGACRAALTAAGFRVEALTVIGSRQKRLVARIAHSAGVTPDPETLRQRLSSASGISFAPPEIISDNEFITIRAKSDVRLSAHFCALSTRKRGEKVCGDAFSSFDSHDGRFYALLCDGMGSGADAALAARTCCVFLEKMLEGGNDPAFSLDMLNTFLRSKGYECFATVDLLCIDLYDGSSFFIKGGAAPSYLIRSGEAYTVGAASAPVGIIKELHARKIKLELRPGDRVIMVSDGVADDSSPLAPALLTGGAARESANGTRETRGTAARRTDDGCTDSGGSDGYGNCGNGRADSRSFDRGDGGSREKSEAQDGSRGKNAPAENREDCVRRILRAAASACSDDATVCCIDIE